MTLPFSIASPIGRQRLQLKAIAPESQAAHCCHARTDAGFGWPRLRSLMLTVALFAGSTTALAQGADGANAADNDFSRLIFEAEILGAAPGMAASGNGAIAGDAAAYTQAAETTIPTPVSAPLAAATGNPPSTNDIPRYEAAIAELLANSSPYSDPLREQYLGLGELYQQQGDHEEAIATFEGAMHIDRVNDGLFTLRQLPLVENIIESYTALADLDEINDHQEYLYYIQQKSYAEDDPRLLAAKERWADWNVQSFLKEGVVRNGFSNPGAGNSVSMGMRNDFVAVQNPNNGNIAYVPRNQMNNLLNSSSTMDLYTRSASFAVPPEVLVDERLRRARDLYEELLANEDSEYRAGRGVEVEHKLANIAYAIKKQLDSLQNSVEENSLSFNRITAPEPVVPLITSGYTKSRDSLESIIARLEAAPDRNAVELARAWINLGDWHLSYERLQRGRDAYEQALAILTAAELPADQISTVFNPSPLIPVPGFALHPYSRSFYGISADAPLDFDGYIDLTLTLNSNGVVKGPRISSTSVEINQRLRSVLLDYLREHRMRPLAQDGKLVKESELTLRIHYSL